MTESNTSWPNPEIENALRRALGLYKFNCEEAAEAYNTAAESPLSPEQLDHVVGAATRQDPAEVDSAISRVPWADRTSAETVREEMLQLYRDEGELDEEVKRRMKEHRKRLLNDDGEEDETR